MWDENKESGEMRTEGLGRHRSEEEKMAEEAGNRYGADAIATTIIGSGNGDVIIKTSKIK